MKTTESTYLPNDDINVFRANSRKNPSGNESASTGGGGGGNPPLNVDIVAANTTGEERTAQPLANHVQNAVK